MSLINEALRKARKEAAERDAEERGVTYRPPRAHLPAERSWLPALAGVALGAVLAAAAFWLLLPRGTSNEAPEPAHATVVVETAPTEPSAGGDSGPREAEGESSVEPRRLAEEPAPESDAPAAVPPAPPSEPAGAQRVEPETPEPAATRSARPIGGAALAETPPTPPSSSPPSTSPSSRSSQSHGDEVRRVDAPERVGQVDKAAYVLEATVDGVALRLDFIVWGASPFAQINGRQVAVGQSVEGFLVREISREVVTLEGETGPFTLRIR